MSRGARPRLRVRLEGEAGELGQLEGQLEGQLVELGRAQGGNQRLPLDMEAPHA